MEKHVNVIGALQIGLSIFGIIIGIIIFVILCTIGNFVDDKDAQFVLTLIGKIVATVLFLMSIPGIVAGIGLMQKREWARILTLILSVIRLVNFPLGTALGIYSIWALVQEETIAIFKGGGEKLI